jgi:hypothetical protein
MNGASIGSVDMSIDSDMSINKVYDLARLRIMTMDRGKTGPARTSTA